jgi:membrane-bound lytic murein transglycosylase A
VPLAAPPDVSHPRPDELYELKEQTAAGRVDGKRDSGRAPTSGGRLRSPVWRSCSSAIPVSVLPADQGSGRVRSPGAASCASDYADQNGYPFRSIGRLLVERG